MQTIYTPWACLLSMEQLYYYSGGGRGCQGVGRNFGGVCGGLGGAGAGSRRVGAGSWGVGAGGGPQGVGRRGRAAGGGPQARRCEASPTAGGARRSRPEGGGLRPEPAGFADFGWERGRSRGVCAGSRRVGAGGGPQARRCGASPMAGGARRAARRAAACGRILRFLQILMWGQSSSTGTVLPSVRMTLTRLGRQMACSPSLASQPFLMHTWSGQSLVIKAMR